MKVCGIDLGTTYSAISWYDEDNNRVITVELVNAADGQRILRSVVYYPQGGQPVFLSYASEDAATAALIAGA